MKKVFATIVIAICTFWQLSSQAPQGINYQAVLRDNNGTPIANQNVSLRFSIISGTALGPTVYQELYSVATNPVGMINLIIGQGTAIGGSFSAINWGSAAHFLKVEFDPQGGSAFLVIETKEFMSVPYALNAGNSSASMNALPDVDTTGLAIGQVLKWNGTAWTPANDSLGIGGGGGDDWGAQSAQTDNTLTGNGTNGNPLRIAQQGATNGNVLKWNGNSWVPNSDNDSDGQTLTINGNTLTISGGNSITIPSGGNADNWGTQTVQTDATLSGNGTSGNVLKLAPQGAATGSVLKWNGSAWAPANDSVGTGGGGGAIADYAVYSESVSSGSNSSTTLIDAGWASRQLNTTEIQTGSSITRSSNTITLQPGTYNISASATWGVNIAFTGSNSGYAVAKAQLRLRNTTANTSVLVSEGQSIYKVLTLITGSVIRESYALQLQGTITVNVATNINLQHFIDYTTFGSSATYDGGAPLSTGENEVYSRVVIMKID